MSKILFLYEYETPTSSGMREFYTGLCRNGVLEEVRFKKLSQVKTADINMADVLVLIRATDFLSVSIAKKASESGRFVISFYDDDLLNRPADRPIISWRRTNVSRVLKHSDLVLSPSGLICEKYKKYVSGNRVARIDTAVCAAELRTNPKTDSEIVRIVYAANPGHAKLFEKYIEPSLIKLDETGKKIRFSFIGVRPNISKADEYKNITVEYIPGMPFLEYRKYMDSHDYDIGLAPIENDDFAKCKYFNKFIEYAIFQIPCVFSKTEPYTYVIKDGENGYLVDNDPDIWGRKITEIIADKDSYKTVGERAIECIKEDFTPEIITEKLFSNIPELKEYGKSGKSCRSIAGNKLYERIMRGTEVMYLVFYYLKLKGGRGMFNKAFSHIKGIREYENKKK